MEEEDLYGFHCSVVGDSEQLQSSVAPPLPSEETLKARIIRAKIGSHPLYPKLLDAYIDCQKVGASLEMVEVLDEIGEHNSAADDDDDARLFWGADPELDDFMETYCNLLVKLKSELSRTFDEATAILKDIETQLNSLCVCDGSSVLRNNTTVTGSSEDDFLNTRGEENETIGWKRINEDRELKDKLLLKYNGYISNLKHQFSKNKKKEKLPKEARQILLAWWNIHLNWPYPTERDKVALAEWSGLDQKQINNWFINRRKRHWKPTVEMQASLLDALYGPPSDP